ncbi:MAG: diguanylate cyclase [Terracidiphilus sp.]|nr:diguanylate cyclase [Terracidiphilus sp.]
MADSHNPAPSSVELALRAEIERLSKVVKVLMDRAERSTQSQASEFGIFQSHILLDSKVHLRTAELEAAFRENQKVLRALKESESRFRGLVNQSLVGISVIEGNHCSYANPKLASMFGYTVEEMLNLGLDDILPADQVERVRQQIQSRLQGEVEEYEFQFIAKRRDGSHFEIEAHSSVMEINGKPVLISMMIDITERMNEQRQIQALQEQLREQAIRDALTGLYNRQPLNEFFDREIRIAIRSKRPISVVLADMDHFKTVNDTYGHQAGDDALIAFSKLLRNSSRATDICCRYGGEEFLILYPDMPLDLAIARTDRIRAIFEKTAIASGAARFHLTASFGISAFPLHGSTRETLIAAADHALYAVKHSGRNQVRSYSPEPATKQ